METLQGSMSGDVLWGACKPLQCNSTCNTFVSWFGGACLFSSFAVHFRYIDLEYLVSKIVAGVVVKGSLGTGRS
jgi:hypothetical protein